MRGVGNECESSSAIYCVAETPRETTKPLPGMTGLHVGTKELVLTCLRKQDKEVNSLANEYTLPHHSRDMFAAIAWTQCSRAPSHPRQS